MEQDSDSGYQGTEKPTIPATYLLEIRISDRDQKVPLVRFLKIAFKHQQKNADKAAKKTMDEKTDAIKIQKYF